MDQLEQLPLFCFLISIFLTLYMVSISPSRKQNQPLLPSPSKLPIIGSIHHLFRSLPHHGLRELASKYGPLMLVKLGQVDHLVVTSQEAAEDVLKTQELKFACRSKLDSLKFLSYDYTDMPSSPYGRYYRQLRKISLMHLLHAKRTKSFNSVRKEEASNLVKEISMNAEHPIDLSHMLMSLTNSIAFRTAVGNKCQFQESFFSIMREQINLIAGLAVVDLFPSLSFLDVVIGTKAKLKRMHKIVDGFLDEILREHERNLALKNDKEEDLLDVLLKLKESELDFALTADIIKGFIMVLVTGGTDTTFTILEWAMSELMRNPEVMEKAQHEVRQVLRGRTTLEECDIQELKFLKQVVKETLRLHPSGPLVPRECRETCQVRGYTIPAGTRVLVNVWALGRDPRYWEDADSFKPERFDENPIDFKGTDFCFLPFGAGRRMCPGMTFGLDTVKFALAHLLCYFDWKLPDGMKPDELDMSETFSTTVSRKSELYLLASPHFPLSIS